MPTRDPNALTIIASLVMVECVLVDRTTEVTFEQALKVAGHRLDAATRTTAVAKKARPKPKGDTPDA